MIRWRAIPALALVAGAVGCAGFNPAPPPPPATVNQVDAEMRRRPSQQEAYQYLTSRAQKGEIIGDLATPETQARFTVMADSIVVGLEGRGTDRYDPKMKPALVKLLVKNYDSLDVASQIMSSKDAAPVRVVAELPAFVRDGDKFDVTIQSLDPSVNLEGGTLVDTPLARFIEMDATHEGFRTRSGLVSQGTEAYARGDVTLNAGYKDGVRLKGEIPSVGYIPAGARSEKTWGCRLLLKKPDASTSMLLDAAFKNRFGNVVTTPQPGFLVITMPNRYQGYYKRFLDVVVRIPVRPPAKEERLRTIDSLAAVLNHADPQARYDAECGLEAYGRESAPALLESMRSSNVQGRQSALRVLAFVDDARVIDPLIEESRRSQGRFRAESAYLLSILGGNRGDKRLAEVDRINQRLAEMLDDPDPQTRFAALMALVRTGVADLRNVKAYYSPQARNFAMYLVEGRGDSIVVVQSVEGVRSIALFGAALQVKCPFRGGIGPVTVNVTRDGIEVQHKRREGAAPITLRTHEIANLVSALDRMNVSVNDIVGLLAQMSQQGAMEPKLYWAE